MIFGGGDCKTCTSHDLMDHVFDSDHSYILRGVYINMSLGHLFVAKRSEQTFSTPMDALGVSASAHIYIEQ